MNKHRLAEQMGNIEDIEQTKNDGFSQFRYTKWTSGKEQRINTYKDKDFTIMTEPYGAEVHSIIRG